MLSFFLEWYASVLRIFHYKPQLVEHEIFNLVGLRTKLGASRDVHRYRFQFD